MIKHTQKSWRAQHRQPDQWNNCWCVRDDESGAAITGWGSVTQTEEHARLIAAAPDLLAACEAALAWTNDDRNPFFREKVETAIAKAKGKQT